MLALLACRLNLARTATFAAPVASLSFGGEAGQAVAADAIESTDFSRDHLAELYVRHFPAARGFAYVLTGDGATRKSWHTRCGVWPEIGPTASFSSQASETLSDFGASRQGSSPSRGRRSSAIGYLDRPIQRT
jgi:hypothetical protein